AGVPVPGERLGQLAEQVVGWCASQQHAPGEEFALAQQHLASRIHDALPKKPMSLGAVPASAQAANETGWAPGPPSSPVRMPRLSEPAVAEGVSSPDGRAGRR